MIYCGGVTSEISETLLYIVNKLWRKIANKNEILHKYLLERELV